jgi:hypothetical protein
VIKSSGACLIVVPECIWAVLGPASYSNSGLSRRPIHTWDPRTRWPSLAKTAQPLDGCFFAGPCSTKANRFLKENKSGKSVITGIKATKKLYKRDKHKKSANQAATPRDQCWWKSGPKGGRRHNSPLSSFPPFACYYEATSSTKARKGNAKHLTAQ